MKKLITTLSVLVLALICVFALPVHADAATEDDFRYHTYEGEVEIFEYKGSGGDVTIPSTHNGYPVTTIGIHVFKDCDRLTSVTIPGSVTTIRKNAFENCKNLTTLNLSKGLTTIGEAAFRRCESLTAVAIPDSVTTIDVSAFKGCSSLTSVAIPNGVFTIRMWAFEKCTNLTTVFIPNSVTRIETGAFHDCDNLTNVYYSGTQSQWNNIEIGLLNEGLRSDTIDYNHTHTYDRDCDTSCNVCGAKRTIKHTYKTTTTKATLKKDGSAVKKCTKCGDVESKQTIKKIKSVKLSKTTYTYNGKAQKPSVTVTDSDGKTLKKGTDYTVTYAKGRKNVGTYRVTIKFKGNYSGTKTLTFKINPPKATLKKVSSLNDALKVTVNKKTTQVTGYQIQYSTSKSFSKATTKTIKSAKTTSLTLKKLKSNKKYFVRVRTFKTVKGTKFYSGWSSYKTARTK